MKEAIPKIIIPVRMKSSRLSGKPLLDIQGVPMVIRVAQICKAAVGLENIIISTPDDEIREVVTEYGFNSVMSGDDCVSGTDRLYEYALNHKDNLIINVQGDEPMITQEIVKDFYTSVVRLGKTCIGVSQISNESEINSEGVVKVAISGNRIIYASRKPIGISYKNQRPIYFKHTGLYSFSRKDLLSFGKFKPGSLEISEEIEILRLIERHKKVYSVTVPNFGRAVDTPEDYEYVNRYFQNATSAIV
jgi:3-deoxy-manno-octulosonate cytidylyltransferase (CMP-KDO synthetase)